MNSLRDKAFKDTFERLNSKWLIENDWDGEGETIVHAITLGRANLFLDYARTHCPAVLKNPHVSADTDGRICFEWWQGSLKVSLFIGIDSAYALRSTPEEFFENDIMKPEDLLPIWNWLIEGNVK